MSDIQRDLGKTAAIIRTYNFTGIGDFVQRLIGFGIGHVVVVVPKDQDNGVTAPILATFDTTRVHLVEQSFKKGGQAWSAMLNAGLDYIETCLDDDLIDYVLMVSNTVVLTEEHLKHLYITLDLRVAALVAGATFRGVGKDGEEVSLGASYNHHYRNTLALYRAETFQLVPALRRFDEAFDVHGGMEDLAWKLMLEGSTYFQVAENVVTVPLLVHTHRTPAQQAEYEALMEEGIKAVEKYVAWFLRE